MKYRLRFHHLLVTGIVALAAALAVTGVAHASHEPPTVPTEIQVRDGNKVFDGMFCRFASSSSLGFGGSTERVRLA